MDKFEETNNLLKSLLENNKDEKQVKSIGEALATLAEAKKEHDELKESHEKFVLEYGELIKQVGTSEKPTHEDPNSSGVLTLEDIIRDVTNKSKEEK